MSETMDTKRRNAYKQISWLLAAGHEAQFEWMIKALDAWDTATRCLGEDDMPAGLTHELRIAQLKDEVAELQHHLQECQGEWVESGDDDGNWERESHAAIIERLKEQLTASRQATAAAQERAVAAMARANGDSRWITEVSDLLSVIPGKTLSITAALSRINLLKEERHLAKAEAEQIADEYNQVLTHHGLARGLGVHNILEILLQREARVKEVVKAELLNKALHRAETAEGRVRELDEQVKQLHDALDPTTSDTVERLTAELAAARRGGDRRLGGAANASESRRVRIVGLEADLRNWQERARTAENQLAHIRSLNSDQQRRDRAQKITHQRYALEKLNRAHTSLKAEYEGALAMVAGNDAVLKTIYGALRMNENYPQTPEQAVACIEALRSNIDLEGSYQRTLAKMKPEYEQAPLPLEFYKPAATGIPVGVAQADGARRFIGNANVDTDGWLVINQPTAIPTYRKLYIQGNGESLALCSACGAVVLYDTRENHTEGHAR
jgi:DNA repair exonuclease SbcCD ATPase subunit